LSRPPRVHLTLTGTDADPGHFVDLAFISGPGSSSGQDAEILPNGTLVLTASSKEVQGKYMCHASNGVGTGISSVVDLIVKCESSSLQTDRARIVSKKYSFYAGNMICYCVILTEGIRDGMG
jgi:hypothetical protein